MSDSTVLKFWPVTGKASVSLHPRSIWMGGVDASYNPVVASFLVLKDVIRSMAFTGDTSANLSEVGSIHIFVASNISRLNILSISGVFWEIIRENDCGCYRRYDVEALGQIDPFEVRTWRSLILHSESLSQRCYPDCVGAQSPIAVIVDIVFNGDTGLTCLNTGLIASDIIGSERGVLRLS